MKWKKKAKEKIKAKKSGGINPHSLSIVPLG